MTWILPGLLVLAWIALWLTRRRVRPWFFATAVVLAVLCFPAGMIAGHLGRDGTECSPDNLCFSGHEVDWWRNGLHAFPIIGMLAAATLIIEFVRRNLRHATPPPPTRPRRPSRPPR